GSGDARHAPRRGHVGTEHGTRRLAPLDALRSRHDDPAPAPETRRQRGTRCADEPLSQPAAAVGGAVSSTDSAPLLTAIPRDIAAVTDYERYARARLDDNAWT